MAIKYKLPIPRRNNVVHEYRQDKFKNSGHNDRNDLQNTSIYSYAQNCCNQNQWMISQGLNTALSFLQYAPSNCNGSEASTDETDETNDKKAPTSVDTTSVDTASSNTDNTPEVEERADKIIDEIITSLNLPESFNDLKNELTQSLKCKYTTITQIAKQNSQTLDDETIKNRLTYYAKAQYASAQGLAKYEAMVTDNDTMLAIVNRITNPDDTNKINDQIMSEILLETKESVIVEYNAPTEEEKQATALNAHYNRLTDNYIQSYDLDNNGSIGLMEMFEVQLIELYLERNMTLEEAQKAAKSKVETFKNIKTTEIETKINNCTATTEETIYYTLLIKFEVLEKNQKTNTEIDELNQSESTKYAEDIKTLSREEVKRYFIAMSNREYNGDNSMTAGEYFVFEDDIQNRKAQYWLNGADKLLEKIEEQ